MDYKYSILALAVVLLLAGCLTPPPSGNNTSTSNVTFSPYPSQNATPPVQNPAIPAPQNTTTAPKPLPSDYSVSMGDTVWVDYTLWVKGKVYDTNNATLANESGIYSPMRKYEPLKFNATVGSGMITGFVLGTIGMTLGETVTFNVAPERGYGPYDPKKVVVIDRYYNRSLYETIPRSYFTDQGITNVTNGTSFNTTAGIVFIADLNDENATLYYMLQKGQNLTASNVPQRVVEVYNSTATLEYMLQENKTYLVANPQTGAPARYTVIGKTDQNITLDGNHPLANETLRFQVTLLNASLPS